MNKWNKLDKPSPNKYLVKYTGLKNVTDFLSGNLFFNSVFNYDDYFEAISPVHLLIHHIKKNKLEEFFYLQFKEDPYLSDVYDIIRHSGRLNLEDKQLTKLKSLLELENESTQEWSIEEVKDWLLNYMAYFDQQDYFHYSFQKRNYVNCWFQSPSCNQLESYLMWKNYADKDSILIAIQFKHLEAILTEVGNQGVIEPLNKTDEERFENIESTDFDLFYGRVDYRNYLDIDLPNKDNDKPSVFFKDLSYQHENEFRILSLARKNLDTPNFKFKFEFYEDIRKAMKFIVHPSCDSRQYSKIRNTLERSEVNNIQFSKIKTL